MKVVARSSNTKSKRKSKQKLHFNVQGFLDSAGVARRVEEFQKSQTIYSQGEPATTVMYVQEGGVKLSVVNDVGKEAVLAILGPDDFLVRAAWRVSLFAWVRPPRLPQQRYLLLKEPR